MITHKIGLRLISVSTVMLIIMSIFVATAQAASLTPTQINEQKRLVLIGMVDTLEAHFKLLQMHWIIKLEAKVSQLQAQLNAN